MSNYNEHMKNGDGNLYALDRYLEEQESNELKYEHAWECLKSAYNIDDINNRISALREEIVNIYEEAKDYYGCDLTEELNDALESLEE